MSSPDSSVNRIAQAYLRKLEASAATTAKPLPSIAGRRVMRPGDADTYLMDPQGYRRRIANQTTYNRLFRDWSGIIDLNLHDIAQREALAPGTLLVRADRSDTVYLVDAGRRRRISNAAVMDKYWFNWLTVCVMREPLVERIPMGREWE